MIVRSPFFPFINHYALLHAPTVQTPAPKSPQGYTVFETGACGLDKSSIRTLLRMKVIDSILASLVYYVIGYGLTYNPPLSSECRLRGWGG